MEEKNFFKIKGKKISKVGGSFALFLPTIWTESVNLTSEDTVSVFLEPKRIIVVLERGESHDEA